MFPSMLANLYLFPLPLLGEGEGEGALFYFLRYCQRHSRTIGHK
jgi:hypothetical protein